MGNLKNLKKKLKKKKIKIKIIIKYINLIKNINLILIKYLIKK